VKKLFTHPDNAEYLIDKHAEDPEIWGRPLAKELEQAGAARDPYLITAAQELMILLDARGSEDGRYIVSVQNSQGVQIGDGNTQANYFGGVKSAPPASPAGTKSDTPHRQ